MKRPNWLIFLFLLFFTNAGLITPKTPNPIQLSYNNAYSYADYTFSFQIETLLPPSSVLKITFPPYAYPSGLGITNCQALDSSKNSLSCTISQTTAIITIGELSNTPSDNTNTITLKSVRNPSSQGSTGYFKLETYINNNLLDYNDIFGYIGIDSQAPYFVSSSVTCTSGCAAGSSGTYVVYFSAGLKIPSYSRINIYFPSTLTLLSYIPCTSSLGNVECYLSGTSLATIQNLSSDINGSVSITFTSIQNPSVSGAVGSFFIDILDSAVNSLIATSGAVSGPVLTAGPITSKICPDNGNPLCTKPYENIAYSTAAYLNSYIFTIQATTTNNIPSGGVITISFPSALSLISDTCQVLSGLTNIGKLESQQVTCIISSNSLKINNFRAFPQGTFSLQARAQTPVSPASIGTFTISTYTTSAMTVLIDQITSSSIFIDEVSPATYWDIMWFVDGAGNNGFRITFKPTTAISPTNNHAFKIIFPDEYIIGGTVTVNFTPGGGSLQTPTFTTTSNSLLISIPNSLSIPTGQNNRLEITSSLGISKPTTPGTYYIETILKSSSSDLYDYLYPDTILSPTMSSISLSIFSLDINKQTVYDFSFVPTLKIPKSVVPSSLMTTWGTIELQFPMLDSGNNLWSTDLGTGLSTGSLISCKSLSGIVPATGTEITCTLTLASGTTTTDYAKIRITNFEEIASGITIRLQIAGITNIATDQITAKITINTYSITQKLEKKLNSDFFVTPTFYYSNDPNIPPLNGKGPISEGGDGTNVANLNPATIGEMTELSFPMWLENAVAVGDTMIIKLPSQLILTDTGILCYININTAQPCYSYPVNSWIVVQGFTMALSSQTDYTFSISGLQNPGKKIILSGIKTVTIHSNKELEYINYSDFSELDPGSILVSVTPDSYSASNIDTSYTWLFTPEHDLSAGSTIVLVFPRNWYVLLTSPSLEFSIYGSLLPGTGGFTYTVSSATITISNFQDYEGGNPIYVKINHILNPLTSGLTDYFTISTYSNDGHLIDTNQEVTGILITQQNPIQAIQHLDFYGDPSNGNTISSYLISIILPRSAPAGSTLDIAFPSSNFPSLPTSPICALSGALTTFASCVKTSSSIITITTDETLLAENIPLNITIYNVNSFAAGLTSDAISVSVSYSGVIYMESPDGGSNRQTTTEAEMTSLDISSVYFSPKTAAEAALYSFGITTTHMWYKNCTLNIEFPDSFPRNLGNNLKCTSDKLGLISCWANKNTLIIQGTKDNSPSAFILNVTYITNPNIQTIIGTFNAFTKCGLKILDYGTLSLGTYISDSPQSMYISSLSSDSLYTRYNSSLIFTISTTINQVGSPSDLIFIDFPIDYDINNSQLNCNSSMSSLVSCSSLNNRLSVAAYDNSIDNSQKKSFTIGAKNIENPENIGITPYISLAIYNSGTDKVIARTMPNLNRVHSLSYEEGNFEININYGLGWTVGAGTATDIMYASIENGAPAEVFISGNFTNLIKLSPDPIHFVLGEAEKPFRISCEPSLSAGNYIIGWTISGKLAKSTYSPIRKSEFSVISTNSETIEIDSLGIIPLGGTTLPLKIIFSQPPSSSLEIHLIQLGSSPTNITILPKILDFSVNDTQETFQVTVNGNSEGDQGSIFVYISGANKNTYTLSNDILKFIVGSIDNTVPLLYESSIYHIDMNSANFSASFSEPVVIYWMVALQGTVTPSFNEIKYQNAGYYYTPPIYGTYYSYINETNKYSYNWNTNGLTAQTPYSLFIYYEDLGGNHPDSVKMINFTSSQRFNIAQFSLKFGVEALSESEKGVLLQEISTILKIPQKLLDYRTDYTPASYSYNNKANSEADLPISTTSSDGRSLNSYTVIDILIFPYPEVYYQNSPLMYANSFKGQENTLLSSFPALDTSYGFYAMELIGNLPEFTGKPIIAHMNSSSVTISQIKTKEMSNTYYCLVASSTAKPSSWQVYHGLNAKNEACLMNSSFICSSSGASVTLSNLRSGVYQIYFSAANTIQRYPDLSASVLNVTFTLMKSLDVSDFSSLLIFCSILLLSLTF
ncbi:unnamed protein product [Blepharisma stoltei]|uniref:Uncharacterized protein n=1 Tax=Blepharisma stoltei TaxID=1481888 RepID=A0AAU9JH03_9CILI|nr:unnamed protein product [Blepharisma stoltei]